jgi:hypothetical protein
MDKSPTPLSLADALALPLPKGRRSAEVLVDGDLEIRFYAPKGHDPQPPHNRDEIYIVAAGRGKVRVGDRVNPTAPWHRLTRMTPTQVSWRRSRPG